MAEVKYQFDGMARFTATMVFTKMASGPLAFLTTGFLGNITFFLLKKGANWLANQGLAVLNIGLNEILVAQQKGRFDKVLEDALKQVKQTKRKLSKKEQAEIDDRVIKAFRTFAYFV